jgi:biotin operon repressor
MSENAVMLIVSDIQKDENNLYDMDAVRLDKLTKAIIFVSRHIRQSGDVELANRMETAGYELLLSAYKGRNEYNHISGYLKSLLSLAIDKEFLSANAGEVFSLGVQAVFNKRQTFQAEDVVIKDMFDIDSVPEVEGKEKGQEAKPVKVIETRASAQETPQKSQKDKKYEVASKARVDDKRQSSRRVEILKTLSREPISIKDIAVHVLGCSEKTIQRELNNMVDEGVVERVGEKRWSKYILK